MSTRRALNLSTPTPPTGSNRRGRRQDALTGYRAAVTDTSANTSYRIAIAKPDSTIGNDQVQSPNTETAEALTTQPSRKPRRRCQDLLRRPASTGSKARSFDSKSISDKTVLVKLPVMTAVEMAPGIARRSSAYWQAIAATALITVTPAATPCGSADGLVMALKVSAAAGSRIWTGRNSPARL